MSNKKIDPNAAQWDSITADAYKLVYGERGNEYSHPALDYERTVMTFFALSGIELTVEEGILFMLCVKLSRLSFGLESGFPPELLRDTIVDIAGYSECLYGVMTYDPVVPEDVDDFEEEEDE